MGFLERKNCEVLPNPTRFQSRHIGEKIASKKMSFALFYISDKTTPAPSNVRWSCLFFHFWSFSFLNVVPVFCFLYGSFSMLRCVSLTFLFFLFFGCSSVSFLTRNQFWVFIFIYLFIIIIIILVLGS